MNRLKFIKVNDKITTTQPFVFNGGFLIVHYLIQEKLYILFDITKGMCLNYIKTENKKDVKDMLIDYGVKFEIEKRNKI